MSSTHLKCARSSEIPSWSFRVHFQNVYKRIKLYLRIRVNIDIYKPVLIMHILATLLLRSILVTSVYVISYIQASTSAWCVLLHSQGILTPTLTGMMFVVLNRHTKTVHGLIHPSILKWTCSLDRCIKTEWPIVRRISLHWTQRGQL